MFNKEKILKEALGPHRLNCDGYGNNGASGNGYILGIVLSTSSVREISYRGKSSQILNEINAFDKAEVENTYIGQINMINVSSFCGPQGAVLGYDILPSKKLENYRIKEFSGRGTTVYSIDPLLRATQNVLGTIDQGVYPILPGAHVPCAGRNVEMRGPCSIYAGIALAIPKNRDRHACLIMEDAGVLYADDTKTGNNDIASITKNLIQSVSCVSRNQRVSYNRIFVGCRIIDVDKKHYGCALVRAPYLVMAREGFNDTSFVAASTLETWIKKYAS